MLYRKSHLSSKRSASGLALFLMSALGLLIAAILLLRHLGRKRNPEKWIRKIMSSEGFSSQEIDFWVAVSKHETGNYTSSLCKNYYNIFGMAVPTKRDSLRNGKVWVEGDQQYMSTYANFYDAVLDQLIWIHYTNFPTNITNIDVFVDTLRKDGYFTDSVSAYKEDLKKYLTGYNWGGGSSGGSGASSTWLLESFADSGGFNING